MFFAFPAFGPPIWGHGSQLAGVRPAAPPRWPRPLGPHRPPRTTLPRRPCAASPVQFPAATRDAESEEAEVLSRARWLRGASGWPASAGCCSTSRASCSMAARTASYPSRAPWRRWRGEWAALAAGPGGREDARAAGSHTGGFWRPPGGRGRGCRAGPAPSLRAHPGRTPSPALPQRRVPGACWSQLPGSPLASRRCPAVGTGLAALSRVVSAQFPRTSDKDLKSSRCCFTSIIC